MALMGADSVLARHQRLLNTDLTDLGGPSRSVGNLGIDGSLSRLSFSNHCSQEC